jgi:hypothetical protein
MSRDLAPREQEDLYEDPPSASPKEIREPVERRSLAKDSPIDCRLEASRFRSAQTQDPRTVFYERHRAYRLRSSERLTLTELGRFRLISTEDLARHAYQGHREEMQQDIRNLLRQSLIRQGTWEGPDAPPRQMLTLTKEGHRLIRVNRLIPDDQPIYYGFLKPRDSNHDADIYRLYQKGAARIEAEGGTHLRVVLGLELQKKLKRDLAMSGPESRRHIASRHGLQVVGEKIPIPDLRIEYQTPDGELARADLELLTEHYRPGQLAEKACAGFSLYAARSETDHLRRVLGQQGLTTGILSL